MATRAQKVKVGGFLLVSLGIIVVGILLIVGFRTGDQWRYWIEFQENILGLNTGGHVVYEGVDVGIVDRVRVAESTYARVEILIDPTQVTLHEGVEARLMYYSLATGTMCVSLSGGEPDAPILEPYSEIPWEPSALAGITSQMQEASEIIAMVKDALVGLEEGELAEVIQNASALMKETQETIRVARETIEDLSDRLNDAVDSFAGFEENIDEITVATKDALNKVAAEIEPLDVAAIQEDLERVLKEGDALLAELRSTAASLDQTAKGIGHDVDNVQTDVSQTLRTWSDTLHAIQDLVDNLKQDPSSLVRGRGKPE